LCLCYNHPGEETHDAVRNTAAQVSFYSHQQQDTKENKYGFLTRYLVPCIWRLNKRFNMRLFSRKYSRASSRVRWLNDECSNVSGWPDNEDTDGPRNASSRAIQPPDEAASPRIFQWI
jgi:hypothetical protein